MLRSRREKTYGPGRCVPLDRNAKVRIETYARAWSARNRSGRQHHRGPLTRAFMEVLEALLWGFHNSRTGKCFPPYEAIADQAQCARSTVAEALKILERAGVLTWQHRIVRIRERVRDLFGHWVTQDRVIRTSNAYAFRDPHPSKSENPPGTLNQEILGTVPHLSAPAPNPASPLEQALQRLGQRVTTIGSGERGGSSMPAI